MYRQPKTTGLTASVGLACMLIGGVAWASPLAVTNTFQANTPATAASVNQNFTDVENAVNDNDGRITTNTGDIADNFSRINDNEAAIGNNFSQLDQRLSRVETAGLQTVAVDCNADSAALDNTVLTPNTEYVLTGICDGQIEVSGGSLGTIVIKGDANGSKDDGITLQAGATDPDTYAAVYGQYGVRLVLENLTIDASAYNGASDFFVGAIGAYSGSQVTIRDVDVVGGDYGIGAYNNGFAEISGDSSVTGFSANGLRSERSSVIRVYDTLSVIGATDSEHDSSDAIGAFSNGVIVIDDDGDANTSHTITAASGPNLSIVPGDNVSAVSAWQTSTIKMRDANITGVVWSGDGSLVDLRGVFQQDGYLNPYRNSVLRFRDSSIANGTADDMSLYAGDFSVFRMDNTTVGNDSGTETASTYRFGVIDLRGTTNFGGRDIFCFDTREVAIRSGVTNVGSVSCAPPPP
ncbi:MAG: hypothetical protein QNJ85_02600 [Gammaproteobacteria bacterium]|nr:hypothetical protein [Gammaproteobacteria bacterium]